MKKQEIKADPIRDQIINFYNYLDDNRNVLYSSVGFIVGVLTLFIVFNNQNNKKLLNSNAISSSAQNFYIDGEYDLANAKFDELLNGIYSQESVNQAILGAQAGVAYVSPFVGRLDDGGHDGMNVVEDIVDVFGFYDISTKVLAASIRSTLHCLNAAKVGADVATVPFDVLMQMAHHPLTDAGAIKFLEDWKKVENSKK